MSPTHIENLLKIICNKKIYPIHNFIIQTIYLYYCFITSSGLNYDKIYCFVELSVEPSIMVELKILKK